MEATEKASIMAKAHNAILVSLGDEVLREVADETDAALLWKKLEGLGVKVEEEDQAIILLCSLPNSYENFVDTMLYGRDTISVNDVKDALQSKELKRRVLGSYEGEAESGLVVNRGRSKERDGERKNKSPSKSKSKKFLCYHCKEQGHFKRDCPHRKNGKEKNESDGKASASVVQESSDEGDFEGSDVLTAITTNASDT
ncbi:hypothetical protein L6164_012082 [Bauhinia variegata]|uniref:Uncharacterized protein n=1 Tax=Bauhinia variegata TaxID=167791 RepID=A0ACB9PE01_BAUVA|nr:hypothetical protein L6164_012082 [Bauhinia variegata]